MRLRNRPMYNLSGATAWKQRTMRLGASWCSEESQICIPDINLHHDLDLVRMFGIQSDAVLRK